jgi:hypothetical protein
MLIDPACGSGHFLLGAFARLLDRWHKHAPNLETWARIQKALDAVHGVDLNPYAVAITRFRLTIAALTAAGVRRLEDAPRFLYHLAVGDSLLHGGDQLELDYGAEYSADRTAATFAYSTENLADLRQILENGQYDVVVGNPPYITVKDRALNQEYRKRYGYCKGTYALTVPFSEKFFALARSGERAGWVGQITSNSFMKREFGAPLIERFFPTKDLRLVVDTSGAYIPGHGTPTVIIVGRNAPAASTIVRAVLGVRSEPGRPSDPAKGRVWTAIVEHINEADYSDEWVTVADLDRSLLATHPWSLAGGGAVELRQVIESDRRRLSCLGDSGFRAITGLDEVFVGSKNLMSRLGATTKPYVTGDDVRDATIRTSMVIFPYNELRQPSIASSLLKWFWTWREHLGDRRRFGTPMRQMSGVKWWELRELYPKRFDGRPVLLFAFVATHNHFAIDREGVVANRHAPVVQLSEGASEEDHLALLAVLNSSTACFWLKQNSHDKGSQGVNEGVKAEAWERFFEFTGTTLQDFPLPASPLLERGRALDGLARQLSNATPGFVAGNRLPSRRLLDDARSAFEAVRADMIAQQEELDWETYGRYGLVDEDLTYRREGLPGLSLGERAFEIVLARKVAAGEEETAWFARHGSTPITEVPEHWPAAYRELVERRITMIESDQFIGLLERPEYKRRWAVEPWEKQEERAVRGWLLDRLEDRRFWFDNAGRPLPRSVAQLTDEVARDQELTKVLAVWEGRPDVPVGTSLARLLAEEAVPYLASYRYKETGLRKREAWEHTWALQRREDKHEKIGAIPVPPKYTSADFARTEYWSHRGKLDVPKERFIVYPDAGRDNDPTAVLGWAGWDHAQQALALAQLIQVREADGWYDEQLVPLVAGLAELLPWVEQWHSEPDEFYGGVSPAEFFAEHLDTRARQVGRTVAQLAAWRPTPARRGRARKAATA